MSTNEARLAKSEAARVPLSIWLRSQSAAVLSARLPAGPASGENAPGVFMAS